MMRAFIIAGVLTLALSPAAADTRTLLVPPATLYPGDALVPATLIEKTFTGSSKVLSGYVEQASETEGKFARRTLVGGKPIPLAAIRSAEVVFEGQATTATLTSGGLSISTTLLPLESGSVGDSIKARNPDSGLTVTAIAQADGTLVVAEP